MNLPSFKNPILCALDTKNKAEACRLAEQLSPHIGGVKLGLEFFVMHGAQGVEEVSKAGLPIFLDLKFHDIPHTVAEAVRSAVRLKVAMLTLHASGGVKMMREAAQAAASESQAQGVSRPLLLGVTVLTSMEQEDITALGINRPLAEQVKALAQQAKEAGLDGIVCSAWEAAQVKALCGKDFYTIVPGIRPASAKTHDQKRVMTPPEAVAQGADFLVIGRPITEAQNPADAAKEIAASLR